MSSASMRWALLLSAFALVPAAVAQPAMDVAAPEPSVSMLDVPIEDIAASVSGCAILDRDFPKLRQHAMYAFFKSMTLSQIAAMSHGRITSQMLAQARTDLSALPIKVVARPVMPVEVEDPAPPPSNDQAALDESHSR